MENRKIAFLGNGQFAETIFEELSSLGLVRLKDHTELNNNFGLLIVASYGEIIPKEVLEIPKHGSLNVHPSLLPKYRGASPIQTALLNGDKTTGVTLMVMDEKMDHGPIVAQEKVEIPEGVKYKELEVILGKKGAELLEKTLDNYLDGKIKPKEQNHKKATFTKILKRDDGKVSLNDDPEEIERKSRALDPWPGIYIIWKGKRIKLLEVAVEDNKLIIKKVQPEGKKEMSFEDFLRGHKDFLC